MQLFRKCFKHVIVIHLILFALCKEQFTIGETSERNKQNDHLYLPNHIKQYHIRKYNNEFVSRKRLDLLNNNSDKVSFSIFKDILQCPKHEPSLDKLENFDMLLSNGIVTRQLIEMSLISLEFHCSYEKYNDCNKHLFNPSLISSSKYYLIRIINGTLFYDWPIRKENSEERPQPIHSFIINIILNKVNNIKDCFFFNNDAVPRPHYELSSLPEFFPIPVFIQSTRKYGNGELLWPWNGAYLFEEKNRYQSYIEGNQEAYGPQYLFQNESVRLQQWKTRTSKAVLLGAISELRSSAFFIATAYPDLFTSAWYSTRTLSDIIPLNPLSSEEPIVKSKDDSNNWIINFPKQKNQSFGMLGSLERNYIHDRKVFDKSALKTAQEDHTHKYIVVMIGSHGQATSDRLAALMSYSGAVILLQEHDFESHFSKRLQPWIHYVPLLHSMADLVKKVKWLREHDKLAFQLATNARNFGLSYLRYEDAICYAATAIQSLGEILNGSDVNEPFYPNSLIQPYESK